MTNPWRHHWFPTTLQKGWRSNDGFIQWLDESGNLNKKKFGKRATGWLEHGHTERPGLHWENNYEKEFEIDNEIPRIVDKLNSILPKAHSLSELKKLIAWRFNRQQDRLPIGTSHTLSEQTHRHLLELMFSLVDRSMLQRKLMENYSWLDNIDAEWEIGVSNIYSSFIRDREIARSGPLSNHHFLLLHDPNARFVYSDGLQHWIIMSSSDLRIWGRLLVPLSPRVCVYFSTPEIDVGPAKLQVTLAPHSVVSNINLILARSAVRHVYFKEQPPEKLSSEDTSETWLIDPNQDSTIGFLDSISGYSEPRDMNELNIALGRHLAALDTPEHKGGIVTLPPGVKK